MEWASQLAYAALLAVPVGCIAWTVTQEEIFREMREKLQAYRKRHPESIWRQKLAYAPTCPFCLSHYLTAVCVALFRFRMLADDWRGYVISFFCVVLIANVYVTLYHWLRVALREAKASADRAETELQEAKRRLRALPVASKADWQSVRFPAQARAPRTATLQLYSPARRQEAAAAKTRFGSR
jgi:hypothetical protein